MKNFFSVAFLLLSSFIVATGPAYAQVNLGSSSSATNPERSGDATTGLFSSTTGAVSVSSGGTEKMRVNGTGVGIGTASPATLLDVYSSTATTGIRNIGTVALSTSSGGGLFAEASTIPTATGQRVGGFYFGAYDGTTGYAPAAITGFSSEAWSSTDKGSYIQFETTATGSTARTARMLIDSSGNVGIGTTSPASPLSVNGIIESQSGGIKFPDGTTQTTAGTSTASTGMVLLATVNAAAAASVSFNSTYITTAYNKYVLEFDGVYTSDAGTLYLTVSTNNGTSYLSSGYQWYGASGPFASQGQLMLGGPSLGFTQGVTGSSSTAVTAGTIKMSNLAQAVRAHFDWQIAWFSYDGAANPTTVPYVGSNTTTTAINAFQITDGSGGTITGNFHLYGLKGI